MGSKLQSFDELNVGGIKNKERQQIEVNVKMPKNFEKALKTIMKGSKKKNGK